MEKKIGDDKNMLKIEIRGVTPEDVIFSRLYENVTKYEIELDKEYDEEERDYSIFGINLIIYQGKEKTIENFSINTTFEYDEKKKKLNINFNDY